MRLSHLSALCLLIVLPGCFMPAAAANRAGNRWDDAREGEVAEQMNHARGLAAERGFRVIGQHTGWLQETYNPDDEPRFTLPSSGTYTMVAFCDNNCSDVDLEVLSASRSRLGADFEPDDNPVVAFTGSSGAAVLGRVTIPGCSVERCAYGVVLFGR